MKIVYMGTPDFAAHILNELLTQGRHEIAAVVTQPDRPRDRNILTASPVKELALKNNITGIELRGLPRDSIPVDGVVNLPLQANKFAPCIKILQYEKIGREGAEELRALKADIFITAAYGQILTQEILDIAPHGVINVHASLLPKYRGAAPVQWAVIKGEKETGVSIMKTEAGLDCGPVLIFRKTDIGANETAGELLNRLKYTGADALKEALDIIESGKAVYIPQDEKQATFFPPLRKTDGEIDFNKTATEVVSLIRGVNPWPGAYTYFNESILKIWSAEVARTDGRGSNPGRVVSSGKSGVFVECGAGAVRLLEIQAAGGKRMPAAEYIKGRQILPGTVLCKQL